MFFDRVLTLFPKWPPSDTLRQFYITLLSKYVNDVSRFLLNINLKCLKTCFIYIFLNTGYQKKEPYNVNAIILYSHKVGAGLCPLPGCDNFLLPGPILILTNSNVTLLYTSYK